MPKRARKIPCSFVFLWYAQNKEKTQPNHSFVTKEFGCVFLGDYSKIKFRNKKETQTTSW